MRGRFKRQPHVKLCAIRTRAEVDFSVMPFDDDPVADNQPESRAYAKFPIEEERKTVKKLLKVVYCYSLTNDPYA